MFKTIDNLNQNRNLDENCLLVSFDIVNILPRTNKKMAIESVNNILLNRDHNIPPAECIIEASVVFQL